MKAKYLFRSLSVALALWVGAACSNDRQEPEKPQPSGGDDTKEVSVFFPGRTIAEPTTYAGTYAAEVQEKALTSVRIYVFNDNNNQPGKLLGTEAVKLTAPVGNTEAGVRGSFYMRHTGKLHLLATANLALSLDEIEKLKGLDFATFSQTLITQSAGQANLFPMVGEPQMVTISTTQALPSLRFILERLSVRIDIENLTTADQGGEYSIEAARMEGSIDRSYLIREQDPPLTIGQKGAVELNVNAWTANNGVSGNMKKMYAQLYTYENVADAFTLHIKGQFNGAELHTAIPFTKALKRNTRYLVKLRNELSNKVTFDIVVVDWNEGGESELVPGTDATQPTITAISSATASGTSAQTAHTMTYGTSGQIATVQTIALSNANPYYTKITLESPSMESMILATKTEVPWVKVAPLGKSRINGSKVVQDFLVSYAANPDLYPRTAVLEIQNKFLPNKVSPRTIRVTQAAASTSANPLAYFSNANVADLNTFGPALTMDNVHNQEAWGKRYQWGRNVAFPQDSKNLPTINNPKISDLNDSRIWSSSPFWVNEMPNSWRANPQRSDSWVSLVNQTTNAPASYKGNNNGDPSPNGWRIPSLAEQKSIMIDATESNYFEKMNGSVNLLGITERNIVVKGETIVSSEADYFSNQKNVYYGLKMKGTAHMTAYRYQQVGEKIFSITACHLGSTNKTIHEIAQPEFWVRGDLVVRYITHSVWGDKYQSGIVSGSFAADRWMGDFALQHILPIRK